MEKGGESQGATDAVDDVDARTVFVRSLPFSLTDAQVFPQPIASQLSCPQSDILRAGGGHRMSLHPGKRNARKLT